MSSYRGPHAEVRQVFETNPGAIAIESLPPSLVGTAYDVYSKELLGTANGLNSAIGDMLWPAEATQVIHNRAVAGARAYEFYPPAVYADTPFGYISLNKEGADVNADGVTITTDDMYEIPGTARAVGQCNALLPYYKKEATDCVAIAASDSVTVTVEDGLLITAQIKVGQYVFIKKTATWTYVGQVGSIGTSEYVFKLASAAEGGAITSGGNGIVIGSFDAADSALIDRPNMLYDATADFVAARVRIGDVLEMTSLSVADSLTDPILASITAVTKNSLRFNTKNSTAGQTDYDYTKAYPGPNGIVAERPNTILLQSYSVNRLVGFSQSYALQDGAGVSVTATSETTFSFVAGTLPTMLPGDVFEIPNTHSPIIPADNRHMYKIASITKVGLNFEVVCDEAILISGTVSTPIYAASTPAASLFLLAWHPIQQSDVVADFRSVRQVELGVVKRISSVQDIVTAWSRNQDVDVHNELAFMALEAFNAAGGRVIYGVNVDSSAINLAAEYAEALEEMKLIDCYSTVFGTTDGGVNGLMAPYVEDQSAPYEAHERIGYLVYDSKDVLLMGVDSSSSVASTGKITTTGLFNPLAAGLTVRDQVEIYNSTTGELIDTFEVTETPTVNNEIQTDGYAIAGTVSLRFMCGRKDAQAILIGNLGVGNRRVKVLWPGWFSADVSGTRYSLPPYYLAAFRAGLDCGIIASQSMTNYTISPVGLANIQLDTNTYFRKTQLDEIGGGGIDIQIQDSRISQSIKSRHDLTSNMDAVEYREWSITKQADVAAKTIRAAVAPYIGRYNITDNLIAFLYKVTAVACSTLVKDGILSSITCSSIVRDPVIPDKVNFTVNATVFVAGNYYDITLFVKSR